MSTALPNAGRPAFYTVREAAEILRCNKNTLYRAIHEGAFPAVQIRSRFVVPAEAVERFAAQAVETGTCIDVAQMTAEHRTARELAQLWAGAPW